MDQLLVIKERIKKFVGKNEVFIVPTLKFLLTFIAMLRINSSLGYMARLSNGAIALIIALAGSFLPLNLTLVILALVIIAHVYALSMECAIVVLALFLILFLLYFRFASKDSAAVILVPLSFVFKIPYVIPVSMGLIATPTAMVSTGCGAIVYYVLHYISVNAEALGSDGSISLSSEELGTFRDIVDGLIADKDMIVMAVAFAITVLVVYVIRRLSVRYSWSLAIAAGAIVQFLTVVILNSILHGTVSAGLAFLGMIISIILNTILQYFIFDLDYNRTEKVQFEDDEYYYYVKAVPKNTIKLSDNGAKRPSSSVKKNVASPEARTARREESSVKSETVSRAHEVNKERTAVQAREKTVQSRSKGPLGMSGGRPAGEGRKKDQT